MNYEYVLLIAMVVYNVEGYSVNIYIYTHTYIYIYTVIIYIHIYKLFLYIYIYIYIYIYTHISGWEIVCLVLAWRIGTLCPLLIPSLWGI
jgi:hypothetical protein